jgi:hypothetical protein
VRGLNQGHGPAFNDASIFGQKINFGDAAEWVGDCSHGCLFDVENDPSEYTDLSGYPEHQPRLAHMRRELAKLNKTLFLPGRGTTHVQACYSAMFNGGGHFGPFAHIDGYYTDKPRTWANLSVSELASMAGIAAMSTPPLKKMAQAVVPSVLWQIGKRFDKCHGSTEAADRAHAMRLLEHNVTDSSTWLGKGDIAIII